MLHLFALITSSYLTFEFFSEDLSPVGKTRIFSMRSQWKYARRMALAVFAGLPLAVVLIDLGSSSLVLAATPGGAPFLVMGLGFSARMICGIDAVSLLFVQCVG